jgi:hypothetical protein
MVASTYSLTTSRRVRLDHRAPSWRRLGAFTRLVLAKSPKGYGSAEVNKTLRWINYYIYGQEPLRFAPLNITALAGQQKDQNEHKRHFHFG